MTIMTRRFAVAATASIAALGIGAGTASASFDPFDAAVADTIGFRLNTNPNALEPGCSLASKLNAPTDIHVDVTQVGSEAHVSVRTGANFSIDEVLVPGQT